ncbi:MAG: NHLP leader peptide family RiPP precursor [Planctomycetaceae bacterium]|jgi:hypothetical protein|nr:NHLP leader peptide family RiPP precursor [Planctomycetaceae bacterium]
MSDWTKEDLDKVKSTISAKAALDKKFRDEVLANPVAVIEKLAGKKIPDNYSIDVVENKPGVLATFVLPNFYGDKLGNDELIAIAGGRGDVTAANTNVVANAEAVANAAVVTNAVEATDVATSAEVAAEVAIVVVPALIL